MKKVIAALALLASPALMAESHDVGEAGVDYEKLVKNVHIAIIKDSGLTHNACGPAAHGCAILGRQKLEDGSYRAACNVYVREYGIRGHGERVDEQAITINHEIKHCYGWTHKEMPRIVASGSIKGQERWLKRNHKIWNAISDEKLDRLNSSK